MKLSKKEELLALGSALYLMGLEVEGSRARLQELAEGYECAEAIPVTQELLDGIAAFEKAKGEFERLEKRFLSLKRDLS